MKFEGIRTNSEGLTRLITFLKSEVNTRRNTKTAGQVVEPIFYIADARSVALTHDKHSVTEYDVDIGHDIAPEASNLYAINELINQIYRMPREEK